METTTHKETASMESKDVRSWALLCHLSAFSGYVIPLGNIFGPLLIYLLKRDEMPAIEEHGKEALNFNLSLTIYIILAAFLSIILIGIPILIGLVILSLVATILAAIKADDGELYRYPLTIRFIR